MHYEGKIQRNVVRWLQEHPDRNVLELARLIYPREITPNQLRGIRLAIKSLMEKRLIERSGYYHNGACYRVTEKARARPEPIKPRLVK
jgi:hypothetical protein